MKKYIVPEIIVEIIEGEMPLLALPDSFHAAGGSTEGGGYSHPLPARKDRVPVF